MTSVRPNQFPWVSPYITVTDVDAATDFYVKAFDFKLKEKAPGDDGKSVHAELFYKDQILMLGKEGAYGHKSLSPRTSKVESPMNLYLYCENIDQFHQHAVKSGAEVISAPEDMFWGDRMCRVKCPDGYVWAFATNIGECKQQ
jgi:PhnB protein